jgi:hypothetical protein
MKVLVLKKSAHPVNQLILELNRPNLKPKAEAPVQQFQRELKENARAALQSNRDRLNQQQQQGQSNPGWGNLALAGLDVGMQPEVIRGLVKIPGLVRSAASLSKEQSRVLMRSLAQAKGQVSEAVVQNMVQGIKQADQLTTSTIVNADGSLSQSRPLGEVSDRMESRGQARSSGEATTANPNISAEMVAKWSKTKNWKDIEPLIGQQMGTELPEGYHFSHDGRRINRAKGKATDNEMVPLQIGEDGEFKITTQATNRLSIPRMMRQNFEKAYGELKEGFWIHHLIPDAVVRNNEMAKFARRLGYNLDRASNLEGLAGKEQWKLIEGKNFTQEGYSGAVGHWSSHDKYSGQVNRYLDAEFERLENQFGNLDQAIEDPKKKKQLIQEVEQIMEDAENHFRNLIEKGQVETKDGRMTWNDKQNEEPFA